MRTKFKAWAEPFINEHPEVMCPFDKLNEQGSYYLEIGAGKGQFLLDMALPSLVPLLGLPLSAHCLSAVLLPKIDLPLVRNVSNSKEVLTS